MPNTPHTPAQDAADALLRTTGTTLDAYLAERYRAGWRAHRIAQELSIMGGRPLATNTVRRWLERVVTAPLPDGMTQCAGGLVGFH